MTEIVIVGAGGFGAEVLSIINDIGIYDVVGFLDANPEKAGVKIQGIPVLGGDNILEDLISKGTVTIAMAIGERDLRQQLSQKALKFGCDLPVLVHPEAYVARDVIPGSGTIIYPGAVIMPGCELSMGVLINSGVTLGHDVKIGKYSNINPGANIAGHVSIGERVLVGIGSTVLENCLIGDDAKVGAGAVVIKNVPEKITVVGVPARKTN